MKCILKNLLCATVTSLLFRNNYPILSQKRRVGMGGMNHTIEQINTINRSVNIVNRYLLIFPKIIQWGESLIAIKYVSTNNKETIGQQREN